MRDVWLRRLAWGMAFCVIVILVISAVMLILSVDTTSGAWLANLIEAFVTLGAPILGLIIVIRQPRQRIGWLWIFYGLFVGLRTLGHAIYYYAGSQTTGYSPLEYFVLWSTEPANIAVLVCVILLLLWFPDGQLASRRWRFLIIWLFLSVVILSLGNFTAGTEWNGGADAGGIVIQNPYGILPADESYLGLIAFISIVLITVLAVVSLIIRYRSAGQLVRLQLRWFVLGGGLYLFFGFFIAVFSGLFLVDSQIETSFIFLLTVIGHTAIIYLYVAVGIAILRYRLFDIDVIIRKTLQYAILTALLALVYFGSVLLLQNIVEKLTGKQSPVVIVISTLAIAGLFNPLRLRVQFFIDRRFYRQKYDAEKALAQFAATARDEVDMDKLSASLLNTVEETIQPESVSLWLKC